METSSHWKCNIRKLCERDVLGLGKGKTLLILNINSKLNKKALSQNRNSAFNSKSQQTFQSTHPLRARLNLTKGVYCISHQTKIPYHCCFKKYSGKCYGLETIS